MAITTMSIDIIIRPDGVPQILEFNRGAQSGIKGYLSFTGKGLLERVSSDLKKHGGFKRVWTEDLHPYFKNPKTAGTPSPFVGTRNQDDGYVRLKPSFTKGSRHLIYPETDKALRRPIHSGRFSNKVDNRFKFASNVTLRAEEKGAVVEIADSLDSFESLYEDKSVISKLIEQGILDPSFFPKQSHHPLSADTRNIARNILRALAGERDIILKHAYLSCGDGIRIINDPDIDKIQSALKNIQLESKRLFKSQYAEEHDEQIIAQSLIPSRISSVKQSFLESARLQSRPLKTLMQAAIGNKAPRHNVLRLFATYIDGEVILHDGWLKFADSAVNENKKKPDNALDALVTGTMYAGPLADREKQRIFEYIKPEVTKLFDHLSAIRTLDKAPSSEFLEAKCA